MLIEVTVGAEKEESTVTLGGKLLVKARPGEIVVSGAMPGGAGYRGGVLVLYYLFPKACFYGTG